MEVKEYVIDGADISCAGDFHDRMAEILPIDGYGRNLDALFDALRGLRAKLVITNSDKMRKNLGAYYGSLIETLRDAEEDNEYFTVENRRDSTDE